MEEKASWDGECWLWRKPGSNGRGYLWKEGRPEVAARVSYEVFIGPLSRDEEVKLLCRNPACIAPAHLEKQPLKTSLRRGGVVGQKWHCRPTDIPWQTRLTETYDDRKLRLVEEKKALDAIEWPDIIMAANIIGQLKPITHQHLAVLGSAPHHRLRMSGTSRIGSVRRDGPHGRRRSVKSRPPLTFYAKGHAKLARLASRAHNAHPTDAKPGTSSPVSQDVV